MKESGLTSLTNSAKGKDMRTIEQYNEAVSGPGKFECEPAWTPYFWDLVMDGDGESVYRSQDMEDDFANEEMELLYDRFTIEGNDIELFPELEEYRGRELQIWEDSQGFVVSRIVGGRN